jgi:redox-sensitive bicupin YhaK (pirin superfamily)
VIAPRTVPLGGLRAMNVRRTLPARERSLIGGWCFLDHYGPDDVTAGPTMSVPAHPHTGLQTATWLFTGEIDHADSAGNEAVVRPGELNLMTAGHGINHSEFTASGTRILHGCQLWIALPNAARDVAPSFEHYAPAPVTVPGATARVFLGSLLGSASPVVTYSPLLGAEIVLDAGARVDLAVLESFEHGVLLDSGRVQVAGVAAEPGDLVALDAGPSAITLTAGPEGARVLLLGGEPFGEEILMWWNFVGRTNEEIHAWRAEWQAAIAGERTRFGDLVSEKPIPAPDLPTVRLKTRGNRLRG